jgi:DNA-directed RNA polymerase subunit RPC12/RpoP
MAGIKTRRCPKCGKKVAGDGYTCPYCGTRLNTRSDVKIGPGKQKKVQSRIGPGIVALKGRAAQDTRAEKTTGGGASRIGDSQKNIAPVLVVAAIAIAVVVSLCVYTFSPLEVAFDGPEEIRTTNGVVKDIGVNIEANKEIKNIYYAVDPTNSSDLSEYKELEGAIQSFTVDITVPDFEIEIGDSELYLYVTAAFDKHEIKMIPVSYEIGYIAPYEAADVLVLDSGHRIISNELIAIVKEGVPEGEAIAVFEKYDGDVVGRIYLLDHYQVRFPVSGEGGLKALIEKLEQEPQIESVTYNVLMDADIEVNPNDARYDSWESKPGGNNWGLEAIDAPGAWDANGEMKSVKVGIVDNILYYKHEDLLIPERNTFIMRTNDFKSHKELVDYIAGHENEYSAAHRAVYHGTHVTGIMAAKANNSKGVAGVNWFAEPYFSTYWYYEKIGNGKVRRLEPTYESFALQITYLAASGCRVINVSIGSSAPTAAGTDVENSAAESYEQVVNRLASRNYDFLIFKAAGNENDDAGKYEMNRVMTSGQSARAHTVIVGSIRNINWWDEHVTSIWEGSVRYKRYDGIFGDGASNYGDSVDVYAPGTDIFSTMYNDTYGKDTGTSMASPMAAGVASLVYSMNPNFTFDYVKTVTISSAKDFVYDHDKYTPIVNAERVIETVKRYQGTPPPLETPKAGFAKGLVQDARTGDVITNAIVSFKNDADESVVIDETDLVAGEYETFLNPGTYTMECSAQGYQTETVYGVVITEGVFTYNILLNLVDDATAEGTASGRIVNAFNASSIADALIKFYRGVNNPGVGEAVRSITSLSDGYYTVVLPPGNYTAHVSANGYLDSATNIVIISGEDNSPQDCTLTPILNPGEIRFVLTWGEYPADLDSHLVGPSPDGGFHTFYSAKNYYYEGVNFDNLDVDDTSSYGPETTSVYVGVDGEYTFYVHDFSNRHTSSGSALSRSGAQVKIYVAGAHDPTVFNVPNLQGTLWKVCTVRGSMITPINEMTYHAEPYSIGQ